MGRRYFCDYCNKTFIDDIKARKKHLSSTHHIKMRKLHYEMHRDLRTVLQEESVKLYCRRFAHNGECQFSGNCKYTHYTHEELWNIKQMILSKEYEKLLKKQELPEIATLDSWMSKYHERHKTENSSETLNTFWSYPEYLECRTDLPRSLQRLKVEDFVDDEFEDWG